MNLILQWESFDEAIIHITKHLHICYLDVCVDNKRINSETYVQDITSIVKFLKLYPQITKIHISKKQNLDILDYKMLCIVNIIKANLYSITYLSLRYLKLTISEITLISEALKYNTTLLNIDLMNNHIDDTGASIIADAIFHNTTLKTIRLTNNIIRDSGAVAIAKSLETNNSLESLDLGFNMISFEGTLTLIKKIANYNRELQSLQIDNNIFGSNCYDMLYFMLASSLTLQRVSICSSMFDNIDRHTTIKRNCEFFTNTYWNLITHTIFGSKIHKFIYYILLCNQRRGMLGNITLNNDLLILLFDNLNLKRTLYIE